MRKLLAILSATVMVMALASCSGNTETETAANTTAESQTAETTAVSETTTEATTESTTVVTTFKELIETTIEQITTTKPTTTKPTTTKPATTTAKPTTTATTAKPTTTTTTKPETTRPAKGILSDFESWDLYGQTVTDQIFKGKKLTMVNIWATFCSPCINEMPGLGEIHREYESKGFQIVGIITDLYSEQAYYTAEEIILATNANYTHIALSEDLLPIVNNLSTVVPTTIFVDENGVQVGEVCIGSRDKSAWIKIIDSLLEQV